MVPCFTGMRFTPSSSTLQEEVKEHLEKGAIALVQWADRQDGFYSRYFQILKWDGGIRPIMDLRQLNKLIYIMKFRMMALQQILPLLQGERWLATLDLKDAHFHVNIRPHHQTFLHFTVGCQVYQYNVLPFGLSTVPRVFTKCMAAVITYLRTQGVTVYPYLDDWLLTSKDRNMLHSQICFVLMVLQDLGIQVNWKKSHLEPMQVANYIGAVLDTINQRAFLLEERYICIRDLVTLFQQQPIQPAQSIQRLFGLVQYSDPVLALCNTVIHYAHLKMRKLQLWFLSVFHPGRHSQRKHLDIPALVLRSLSWWAARRNLLEGVPFETRPVQERLEVDEENEIDINEALGLDLFEGDIRLENGILERNSIIGDQYRWPRTIPYVLEDSLDMNAKGLILKAFEQYRLKTCIDFKPWEGEANYISVFKGSGCWSYVGNRRTGRQDLSIGANCDRIGTIEHEFLHALGFWHEQSRSDRDDYVTIMRDRIQTGKEGNFNKYDDKTSDFLNVPYDYTSVMHYSKTAFMNGTEPTIVTNIPAFIDVIGQRMDFSEYDIRKLSKLYNCSSSLSFLEACTFELANVCGMIQSSEDNADWQHITQASSGPQTDHTYAGMCQDTGYFMYFNTSAGSVRDQAILESRFLYPKRGFQCLQFYYYNSGNESDQLNILIKEYTDANPNGTLRLVKTIQGSPVSYWELYHVPLNVTNKFRVIFEGIKGSSISNGGLSIDDINLSETQCPHHAWHIRNFTQLLNSSPSGEAGELFSPPFYSSKGYAFQIALYVNGTTSNPFNLAIYLYLISGANDDHLQWPCAWQQATMVLLDQNPDIRQRMSNQKSITTDPDKLDSLGRYFWDRPDKVGSVAHFSNGTRFMRGHGYGTNAFLTHQRLKSRDFIKDDSIFILTTMEDISHLISTQPNSTTTTPTTTATTTTTTATTTTTTATTTTTTAATTTTTVSMCETFGCQNDGICIVVDQKPACRCPAGEDWWYMGEKCEMKGSTQNTAIIAVSSSLAVFAVMLIITVITTCCLRKKYRKQLKATRN
ncbi:meprin A subunit beta [Hemicordylus capensis]|uniref:meprin A subunit beta n=1 Tax=Hemicordylus capensis TaxID=884348 RepID=UPI0023028F0A|nr:meprin A subunit beta [Hemicordylus capensis]